MDIAANMLIAVFAVFVRGGIPYIKSEQGLIDIVGELLPVFAGVGSFLGVIITYELHPTFGSPVDQRLLILAALMALIPQLSYAYKLY